MRRLDRETFARIQSIFLEAVELPVGAERDAFVLRKSHGDARIQSFVHDLLRGDADSPLLFGWLDVAIPPDKPERDQAGNSR